MQDFLKIHTVIPGHLLKKKLTKGLALALFGIALLFLGGLYLPIARLDRWGWILFLLAITLITIGLVPYRRLAQLQTKPNELLFTASHLAFIQKGVLAWSIELEEVKRIEYIKTRKDFGIKIFLKEKDSLFLPYFDQKAYLQFKEVINFTCA